MHRKLAVHRAHLYLLLIITVQSAHAQQVLPLELGDRVRVTVQEWQVVGTVQEVSADSLFLVPNEGQQASSISLRMVQALEVREPRSRWRGTLLGAGAGLLASGIAAGAVASSCERSEDCWAGLAAVLTAARVTGPLVASGAVIGMILPPGRRWRDVPLRASLGVRTPGPWEPGVALTLNW